METPDFRTFDIADMFAGIAYPEDVVDFYTDAKTAYDFNKLSEEALEAVQTRNEELAKDVAKRREELIRKGESSHYKIHVRGTSRDDRRAVEDIVEAEFPTKKDVFGRSEANRAGDEKHENLMWALHITKIEAPNGAVIASPSESDIAAIRGKAPDTELLKVAAAIRNLQEGAKSGFEALAQEHDFLSSASPEA